MPALANLVRVVSTTTGTGTLTLGAPVQGFLTPVQAGVLDNQIVSYAIEADYVSNIPTSREVGTGTIGGTGTTLTRTVVNSTNANALLSLSGDEQVFITPITSSIRPILIADTTFYVRKDGSDSNSGLADTAAGAFLTIGKAMTTVGSIDGASFNITVQVRAGTYSENVVLPFVLNSGSLTLTGDTTTPTNVVISASGTGVSATGAKIKWNFQGFSVTAPNADCILADGGSIDINGSIDLGAQGAFAGHLHATNNGTIKVDGGVTYTISGSNANGNHLFADNQGIVFTTSAIESYSASVTWSISAIGTDQGLVRAPSMTFTMNGHTVTGQYYFVTSNSVVDTNGGGATYFPGTIAGATASGGQYT